MSAAASSTPAGGREPRLYGNWRAERGWGIGRLSTTATIIVFLAVLAPLLAASTAPAAVLPLAGVGVVVVAAIVVRIGGRSAADVLGVRLRFWRARRRGWTRLSAGVLADDTRAADLPGVLAPLRPLDIDDGRGRRHVLLHNRRTGTLTAILRCAPIGLDLADPDQADQWVAAWGGFLADLGYQPLVRHIAVTVDTAPTGGDALATHVATHLDPGAPRLARQVLSELVADTTARTASVQVWLSVCLDPNRATPKPTDLLAACVEVGRWLPGLETELAGCGVAVQGRATLTWLAGAVRAAFDPAARPHLAAAGLEWADAVPVAAREEWDHYRHESGVSVSWALREAPRQAVDAARPGPAGGARPVRAPGVLAVSALPRRPSGSQGRSPGHRRTDPPRLGRPHPAGRDPTRPRRPRPRPASRPRRSRRRRGRPLHPLRHHHRHRRHRAVRRGRRRRATRRAGPAAAAPPARSPSGRVRRRPRHGRRSRRPAHPRTARR